MSPELLPATTAPDVLPNPIVEHDPEPPKADPEPRAITPSAPYQALHHYVIGHLTAVARGSRSGRLASVEKYESSRTTIYAADFQSGQFNLSRLMARSPWIAFARDFISTARLTCSGHSPIPSSRANSCILLKIAVSAAITRSCNFPGSVSSRKASRYSFCQPSNLKSESMVRQH
jgi:hypothetical protein